MYETYCMKTNAITESLDNFKSLRDQKEVEFTNQNVTKEIQTNLCNVK